MNVALLSMVSRSFVFREPVIKGFDADYAYTIKAFIDMYELTHDDSWIEIAVKLQASF